MMGQPTVRLEVVPGSRAVRDLAAGGAFVQGCVLPLDQECMLVVVAGARELALVARVVLVSAGGAGLELVGFDATLRGRIAEHLAAMTTLDDLLEIDLDLDVDVENTRRSRGGSVHPVDALARSSCRVAEGADASILGRIALAARPQPVAPPCLRAPAGSAEIDLVELDPEPPRDAVNELALALGELELYVPAANDEVPANAHGDPDEFAAADEASVPRRDPPRALHERLRGLTLAQQIKKALSGELSERVLLERMYGKNVWEPLLRNPRLTAPEVARIARMGALPRPLLEQIVGNGAWLQVPEVRRALLSNPRLGTDQILRVLRLLPKHELKLAATQTAYPHAVRDAAKRLVRE
jgi:hypothetical protein